MPTFYDEESRAAWVAKCKDTRQKNKLKRGTMILVDGIEGSIKELDSQIFKLQQMKSGLIKTMEQFKDAEYVSTIGASS